MSGMIGSKVSTDSLHWDGQQAAIAGRPTNIRDKITTM